jgi:hypothetical protein
MTVQLAIMAPHLSSFDQRSQRDAGKCLLPQERVTAKPARTSQEPISPLTAPAATH